MNYEVSFLQGFRVIGFEREFSPETAYREIPKFWTEIFEKYCADVRAGKAPSCPEERAIFENRIGEYGVCIGSADGERFRYLIGGKYTGGEIPKGMSLIEIPQGDWVKFKCIGPMPEALQSLNTQIFREWLPANPDFELSDSYDVEWYSSEGNPTDETYESGIWLPIKRKR